MPRFVPGYSYKTVFPVLLNGTELSEVHYRPTKQTWSGPNEERDWPLVVCRPCNTARPVFDFLYLFPAANRRTELRQERHCSFCVPRTPVVLTVARQMPFFFSELRHVDGSPIRWYDQKARRWKSAARCAFRIMKKTVRPLILAQQPYEDRYADHEGNRYDC